MSPLFKVARFNFTEKRETLDQEVQSIIFATLKQTRGNLTSDSP
jgi:hypothetical protein